MHVRPHARPLLVATLGCLALCSCKFLYQQVASAIREVMRDSNGMVKGEGTTVDGLHEGDWTFYYPDGRKRSRGAYRKDVQTGPWTAWHENGRVEWLGVYGDRGGRSDLWSYYHDNGEVRARGRYREDFEQGYWEFHDRSGAFLRAGSFDSARQVGWWTLRDGDETASGLLYDGLRVGAWITSASDSDDQVQQHAVPEGLVLVREMWSEGGGLRRTGLLKGSEPVGGWASFDKEGQLSSCCVFGNDGPSAVAVFDNSELVAEGLVEGRELSSWCIATDGDVAPDIAADDPANTRLASSLREPLPPLAPDQSLWAQATPTEPSELIAVRLAELRSPVAAEARISDNTVATAAPLPVESLRVVASKQPSWTVVEQKEIPAHVEAFLKKKPKRKRAWADRYGIPMDVLDETGTQRRRRNLEGLPLPIKTLESTDGGTVHLADYRGNKRVLVVVLRGFFGQVCVYCVAQTEALSLCAEKFDDLDLEVLIIYPGPKGNEKSFLAAYEETFGKGAPPYRVFYDPDLKLANKLEIQGGDLVYPTMIYVDEQGVVQYAYTGAHRADRPAAEEIIRFIEDLDAKNKRDNE